MTGQLRAPVLLHQPGHHQPKASGDADAPLLVPLDGHLYRLLVTERGWTGARFSQWLTDSLGTTLLRP